MEDLSDAVEGITHQTAALSWDSLPRRLHLDLASVVDSSNTVLIGKIIGLQPPGKHVIIRTIHAVWRFAVSLKVEALDDSTYLLRFSRHQDKKRVLPMVPWNFKGYLMVFQEWAPALTLEEIDLSLETFWIQLHGLPLARMNRRNIAEIGASIGTILTMELLLDGIACKRFFCI